jgi:hypothetical protein
LENWANADAVTKNYIPGEEILKRKII